MKKTPESSRAYRMVRDAVKRGHLIRPNSCEGCGATPERGRDGRSMIQGHHHLGYDRPLDVQWLCVSCHRDETPVVRGENNPQSRLTDDLVRKIRGMAGNNHQVAKELGVDPKQVWRVRNGESWTHVAALSPEAPARIVGTIAHVSNGRSELAAHITAALTPRHEAPAEGAGEDFFAVGEFIGRQPVLCVHGSTDPNNLCPYCEGEKIWGGRNYRARSSAPEAREGEAVAYGADHQPWCQPGDQTQRAFRLRFEDPDMREMVWTGPGAEKEALAAYNQYAPAWNVYLFSGHPRAAPSADKLREFGQHTNLELSYRHGEEGDDGSWQVHRVNGGVNDREWTLIGSGATPADAIDQALAALKAEGA